MIYTTTDFDGQQATDYTLLIGVGATSNRLAVVDQARQLKFAASYDPANVEPEVIAVLDLDFGKAKLSVSDCRYTFIPADVYDEQQRDTYLRYLPFDGVGATHIADITPLGIKLLHQTNRMGLEAFTARYPNVECYPQVQSVLSAVAARATQGSEPRVIMERHAPWITIGVFDSGRFLYSHDFESANEDDFTYHLLSVVTQFGLADRQPTILLAGDIAQGDGYYDRAATYGGKVELADSGALTGIHLPDDMLPHQHRFLSLFGLYQCES
ncbi:DUF3822 family protein [Parapedobacter sp. 10938]|uniref:DUF3822 family protein n=1 Tax=Parapedobacter flavus TaxID=3110225 RepID=UPI002DBB9EE0|nr:DUF3822 family protein [Parapedobacter sp. 10938]MEC3879837.1 DUF3822 family protein [Parapedobacter sp. 10938]